VHITSTRPPLQAGLLASLSESERWLLAVLLAGLIVALGTLATMAQDAPWLDGRDAPRTRAEPHWLAIETVRATSRDGDYVKARVALDVPDADTRAWLSSRQRQVALLMQVSVAEYENHGAAGGARVQRLADDIRERLNDALEASQVPPVRDVVVEDMVFNTP
jgi:flagellar basal body-associated protein FliL